jgi:hypothetical protein
MRSKTVAAHLGEDDAARCRQLETKRDFTLVGADLSDHAQDLAGH